MEEGMKVKDEKIKNKNVIRKLYDWVLHWAETPYAVPALVLLAFSESSFFPVPPDVLLIALAISIPRKSFYYATLTSISSMTAGTASAEKSTESKSK